MEKATMKKNRAAVLAGLVILACGAHAQPARRQEIDMQAAIRAETVDGDLQGAIRQYNAIVSRFGKTDPSVAARALVRLGQCYEKLGDAQARQVYQQVLTRFAEQAESVKAAQTRLAALGGRGSGQPQTRMLWDAAPNWAMGPSSLDGRWIAHPDVNGRRGLAVRDLVAGESRVLKQAEREGANTSIISPDGKSVAFYWWQSDGTQGSPADLSIRIIGSDGARERLLHQVGKKPGYWIYFYSWSPDGRWIAAQELGRETSSPAVLISTVNGERRPLRVREWMFGAKFSPDGQWLAVDEAMPKSPVRRIVLFPAGQPDSDAIPLVDNAELIDWTPDGKSILFSRDRNDVREMFLLPVERGKAAAEPRRLTVPLDASERPVRITASGAFQYQSVRKDLDGLVAEIDPATANLGKTIFNRPAQVLGKEQGGARISPDGKRVFFTMPRKAILIRSLAGGSEHTVTPQMTAYQEIAWAGDGNSLLAVGWGNHGGGVYRIDALSGATELLTAKTVRTPLNLTPAADGSSLFFSHAHVLYGIEPATGALRTFSMKGTERIVDLRLSRDGRSLAALRGSSVDIVDIASGQARSLALPETCWSGDWSPDGQAVLATCGGWNRPTKLLRIPVDGGAPVQSQLAAFFHYLRLSPDGRTVSLTRYSERRQLWSLENFLPAPQAAAK
jgi:Tol biopolymer transport system component